MADEREENEVKDRNEAPYGTDTGPGVGTSSAGVPAGGGAMAGTGVDNVSSRSAITTTDTDTGLPIGIGQSTTTGTAPSDGLANLDGTNQGGTVGTDTAKGDEPPHAQINDYADPRSEEDRRQRHGGADRTDVE